MLLGLPCFALQVAAYALQSQTYALCSPTYGYPLHSPIYATLTNFHATTNLSATLDINTIIRRVNLMDISILTFTTKFP